MNKVKTILTIGIICLLLGIVIAPGMSIRTTRNMRQAQPAISNINEENHTAKCYIAIDTINENIEVTEISSDKIESLEEQLNELKDVFIDFHKNKKSENDLYNEVKATVNALENATTQTLNIDTSSLFNYLKNPTTEIAGCGFHPIVSAGLGLEHIRFWNGNAFLGVMFRPIRLFLIAGITALIHTHLGSVDLTVKVGMHFVKIRGFAGIYVDLGPSVFYSGFLFGAAFRVKTFP
jgi:gas vesicle protein